MLVPSHVLSADGNAAGGAPLKPVIVDVALREHGTMLGQVVDTAGLPKGNVPVSLSSGQQALGTAKTDANGYFAFTGLRGGMYQVVAAEGHGTYRVWTPGTAPPTAQQGALVIAGEDLTRGQFKSGWKFCLANPWIIAGIVAAAVAIPVAIHNLDDDDDVPRPRTPGGGT
jgi:predicted alpha/beta hydrolase